MSYLEFMIYSFSHIFKLLIPYLLFIHCKDVLPVKEKYTPDYAIYHNLSQVETVINKIVSTIPTFAKIKWNHRSIKQRSQMVIHITNFDDLSSYSRNKLKVLFIFGEHAREFFPVESLIFFLTEVSKKLLKSKSSINLSSKILRHIDLFIVGMMNPDGRYHVEQSKNYCWRGNSRGVDLNRNFGWNFGGSGSSNDKKDEEYRGKHAFSEPETRVLLELTKTHKFDALFSFHSGIKQIYTPFADSLSKKTGRHPYNINSMLQLAEAISKSVPKLAFRYGTAHSLNKHTADGTILDYMAGVNKIPFCLAIELWGEGDSNDAKCFDLFNPPSSLLHKSLEEIQPIYNTIFDFLIKWKQKHREENYLVNAGKTLVSIIFLLLIIYLIILFVSLHTKNPLAPFLPVVSKKNKFSVSSFLQKKF